MPRSKTVQKAGIPYNDDPSAVAVTRPERFRLGEIGYQGLNIFDGISKDELKKELTWPASIKTFKQMSYHSAITAPLTLFENMIGKASFRFIPPPNATEEELRRTRIMQEMLDDMEGTFPEFIKESLSMLVYGFSIHEKVYRRRNSASGSKYNDNVIAWKKLPLRSQDTIEKFEFSKTGNEIIGVKQNLNMVADDYGRFSNRNDKEVIIPRAKYLHFIAGRHRGDPYGKSMLRDAYLAWRYLTAIEEIEAMGVSRDLNGLPMMKIPAQYMAPDASPEQKVVYEYMKGVIRNIQNNQQSGLILPSAVDPETRQALFDFELISTDGRKNYDTSEIKTYYKNLIFTSMFADILITGQGNTGSFALAQTKNTLAASTAEAILAGIVEEINRDLVRQTYELNEWDPARAARLDYEGLQETDVETISKAWQRLSSVGLVPKTINTVNAVLDVLGVDRLPESTTREELEELLTDNTSRSGDGMATAGDGTSTDGSNIDSNDNNLENAG